VKANKLLVGDTASCGCLRKEVTGLKRKTHGASRTRLYKAWLKMMERCFDPNNEAYDRYAGRGITVCERWKKFENFRDDLGEPPDPKLTLERIDNDAGYSPDNCCWATRSEQNRNRRNARRIMINGTCVFNICEVPELVGTSVSSVSRRIKAKVPIIIFNKVFRVEEYSDHG
jgi:hypothetical protein